MNEETVWHKTDAIAIKHHIEKLEINSIKWRWWKNKKKLRQLPVPLLDLSTEEPLTRALPLVFALLDVIVADAFEPEHDDCGFSTMYLAFRSWTELLKLFTSS